MSILFMKDGRSKPWRGKVGGRVEYFATEQEAKSWEKHMKLMLLDVATNDLHSNESIGSLLEKFKAEKTSIVPQDHARIKTFLNNNISRVPLNKITKYDLVDYRNERLEEGKAPSTVRRELALLGGVFLHARDNWRGYAELPKLPTVKIEGADKRRTRRLEPGELNAILDTCQEYQDDREEHSVTKWHGNYVEYGILLCIETGMRLQEAMGIRLCDVDIPNRRLKILKSKTDKKKKYKGRTIALSLMAIGVLEKLISQRGGVLNPSDRIFPMPQKSFERMRLEVYKQANIYDPEDDDKNLTFHDLRHEFASRASEGDIDDEEDKASDLTEPEISVMLGEMSNTMTESYIHRNLDKLLNKITRKLDRQQIGMTWKELVDKIKRGEGDSIVLDVSKFPRGHYIWTAVTFRLAMQEGIKIHLKYK